MAESISDFRGWGPGRFWSAKRRDTMVGPLNRKPGSSDPKPSDPKPWDTKPSDTKPSGATRRTAVGLILGAPLPGACAGGKQRLSQFSNPFRSSQPEAGPPQQPLSGGNGRGKGGPILPLSAAGKSGRATQSMNKT